MEGKIANLYQFGANDLQKDIENFGLALIFEL